ncbi:SHQ1 protein-domain-containing protein [Crucibulum laeve]|uniref:SHQ1 protein-domain-containing protein n=1 Tax=Crucibulum laeve TaxID=68775 RepID=A0A5C3ME62_9AGAR|nr:SHQ1 protein-domain-containing protein [Crucibulum laeve]
MITPRFSCSQTADSVVVSIYCPSIRAADADINVDETLLTVHINPYFLRLNFSHPLLEDDASSANYDPSTGYLTVTLTKENKGQEFTDLDVLAKLLAPRPSVPAPIIEVLASTEVVSSTDVSPQEDLAEKTQKLSLDQERQEILKAAENDWQLPQEVPQPAFNISAQKHYGFLDMHSGYFKHVTHTENEVNELGGEAETCTLKERRQKRIKHEDEKWDEEYYMADFADDAYIQELLSWEHPHIAARADAFEYTEEENLKMLQLPRKEYLSTPTQTHDLYLILITILFSYAYESRTTQHDPTPESAWTICSLTPAFSALDPPKSSLSGFSTNLQEFTAQELVTTLVPSYRRSLAFPLYRSFILAEACRKDIARLLIAGKRVIVRCLLELKQILDHHEVYYVYSKIWLDDFCTWVLAYADDDVLSRLGKLLLELKVHKNALGWDVEGLEAATKECFERESDSDDESTDESSSE